MEDIDAVLPVAPWVAAAVATVLVVALSVPPGGPRAATVRTGDGPLAGRLGAVLAAVLVVVAVAAARLGPDSELRNPLPALLVGLGWPLLLVLPAVVGLARPRPDAPEGAPGDVRPAVAAALGVVAFLTLPLAPTRPALLATAVAAYALVVVAASVAFGRAAVAARFELLGLLVRWGSLARALPRWAAPRGALAVLAVLLGGAWFERYERTAEWMSGVPDRVETTVGLAVALALAGLAALALHLATRRDGSPGTAAAVLLPLTAGTVVAGVLRRALISAQLLADQVAGPRAVEADPLGVVGGQAMALAAVVIGAGAAAAVLARRMGEETSRLPGVAVLLALTTASAWLVLQP